jgi:hypothetical protein
MDRMRHYAPLSAWEKEVLDMGGEDEPEESAGYPERKTNEYVDWRTALQAGETRRALE